MNVVEIARSGLQASMTRLSASASNIATASVDGRSPGWKPADGSSENRVLRVDSDPVAGGGVSTRLVQRDSGFHDPSSPASEHKGMAALPDIDLAQELVEQVMASQAFAANLKLIDTALDLQRQAIHLSD